jgi:hypothetical protein
MPERTVAASYRPATSSLYVSVVLKEHAEALLKELESTQSMRGRIREPAAARVEYRIDPPVAKLGPFRHRSSVIELSIRNPARPALISAGRCVFNELGEVSDDHRSPATIGLAPPLAPRVIVTTDYRTLPFDES